MRPLPLVRLVRGLSLGTTVGMIVLIAGCGRPVGTVSGKVTFMNKPVKGGNVTLVSTEGLQSCTGDITEEGGYTIANVTAGAYKVCVETASLKPQQRTMGAPRGNAAKGEKLDPSTVIPEGYHPSNPAEAALAGANARSAKRYVAIPSRYADPKTTDLEYTVVGGDQKHDLELK